jgi:cytochrome c oxidase subunit 4
MTIRAALFTYAGLMVLLALTVGSTFIPMGMGNSIVNIAIAFAKAALIGWIFMHLRHAGPLVPLTVVVLICWIALMYGLSLNDYFTR